MSMNHPKYYENTKTSSLNKPAMRRKRWTILLYFSTFVYFSEPYTRTYDVSNFFDDSDVKNKSLNEK